VECSVTNTYQDFFEEVVYKDTPPSSSTIHLEFPKRGEMLAVELH
tara:strand:+ start:165 stop:299 length:135 start_codon:yes stop_codon:yes gene_type:complete